MLLSYVPYYVNKQTKYTLKSISYKIAVVTLSLHWLYKLLSVHFKWHSKHFVDPISSYVFYLPQYRKVLFSWFHMYNCILYFGYLSSKDEIVGLMSNNIEFVEIVRSIAVFCLSRVQ